MAIRWDQWNISERSLPPAGLASGACCLDRAYSHDLGEIHSSTENVERGGIRAQPKKAFHRRYHYYIYRNYQKESSRATGIKHALNVLVLGALHRVGSCV